MGALWRGGGATFWKSRHGGKKGEFGGSKEKNPSGISWRGHGTGKRGRRCEGRKYRSVNKSG